FEDTVGDGSVANRSGSQTDELGFRLKDGNGTYLDGFAMKFYVTTNNITFYSSSDFENITNSTGHVRLNFDPICTPSKFIVGEQQWKAVVNDSAAVCYQQNDSYSFYKTNLTVMGDINPTLNKPDGAQNYTQEQTIPFLGSTTDDCGDPLTTTVRYYANHSAGSYNCTTTTQVGANAFTCDLPTSLSTVMGWYNTSMYANKTSHYDNYTAKTGSSGLYYLIAKKRLDNAFATPTAEGWGYKNWNFSVNASSGEPNMPYNISIWLAQGSPTFSSKCDSNTCVNQTPVVCDNCIYNITYWYANFSAGNRSSGQDTLWYYQYQLDTSPTTATTAAYVTLEKDDENITYAAGNNSNANLSKSAMLIVQVYDSDAETYSLNPGAIVNFRINYTGTYDKIAGTNTTNASGHAVFYFTPDCDYTGGEQTWYAEINSSEPNYKANSTEKFNISLNTAGCIPQVDVQVIYNPNEAFIYRNFTINATVTTTGPAGSKAQDVNATITLPAGWAVDGTTRQLENITAGTTKTVWWNINATSYGEKNITVFANSSNAGSDTLISNNFTVYKWNSTRPPQETLPAIVSANEASTFSWLCEAGSYRIANLTINWNSTNAVAETRAYNGTSFNSISAHSRISSQETTSLKMLANQLAANETGYCVIQIKNYGPDALNLTSITLESYYNETVQIQDIQAKINGATAAGIEPSETLFNVSVRIANSTSAASGTLWLNITNSSGDVVNSSSQAVSITSGSVNIFNFTDINTTTWQDGTYSMLAYLSYGSSSASRTESLDLGSVTVLARGKYMQNRTVYAICNQTTEEHNVTLYHPFSDSIQYNITLQVPGTWSYSPAHQIINATSAGNYTVSFNVTSGSAAAETIIINATANYSYPDSIAKSKNASYIMNESNSMPVLEIIRETPTTAGADKVFDSQLAIHNRGCGASNATVIELVPGGWTPASPSIKTNEYGTDIPALSTPVADLITNTITWELGSIAPNKYAVLTYKIKSPSSYPVIGGFAYNVSFGAINFAEEAAHDIQTFNYTNESHIEFDLTAIQQAAYPWPEPRSIQLNTEYNYSLKAANIGDAITGSEWNVTLQLPAACNATQVYNSGTWNETGRLITWQLPNLAAYGSTTLNFTANCTTAGAYTFVARGLRNTKATASFANDISIGCNGALCSATQNYTFTKPAGARYEQLTGSVGLYISYNWTGQNVTIGTGKIRMLDDESWSELNWNNYSLTADSAKVWINHSIQNEENAKYVRAERTFIIDGYADATYNSNGNVTIEKINYVWQTGKLFDEPQNLYSNVKIYAYTPLLQNAALYINGNNTITTGGWGEEFNFSVMAMDRFGRNVTIYAWHKKSTDAEYTQIGSWTCEGCGSWTQANFTYDYIPTDKAAWSFKFNATNPDGATTLDGNAYTVEQDDINADIIRPSADDFLNRSQNTVYSIRVYDRDNQTYPSGSSGKIWLSIVGTAVFESSPSPISSTDGWINRTMTNALWCADQASYFLGKHAWYGGTSADSFVKDNTTSAINFTLVGDLINTFQLPDGSANFTIGSSISMGGAAADDCANSRTADSTIIHRISHNSFQANCTADATGSCSITTDTTFPLGWYNVSVISNKTGYNTNESTLQNKFFLRSRVLLDAAAKLPAGTSTPWGRSPFNFTINITSDDNESVTAYLWMSNSTGNWWIENQTSCTNCSSSYFFTTKAFSNNSIPGNIWYWKFNATSATSYTNNTLAEQSFNVTKDSIDIRNFTGNNSYVNRTSAPNTEVNLSAQVWDLILDQNTLNEATPNITLGEISFRVFNGSSYVENETEESRNITDYIKTFNPDCSQTAGAQYWNTSVIGAQAYSDNTTTGYQTLVINVIGDLNATYGSPTGLAEYETGASAIFSGNVSDDCLSEVSGATVIFNITSGSNSYACNSLSSANPYTCTWPTAGKAVGNYNVTMIASKAYHNNGTDVEIGALKVKSTPSLKAANISIKQDGWAPALIRNFSINVTDNTGDSVNVTLWIKKLGGPWQQIGNAQNCTSCSNTTLWFNNTFGCADVSTGWRFKFNATDTEENTYDTDGKASDYVSSDDTFDIEENNVRIEYVSGNETNSTLEAFTPLILMVYDTDNSTYVSSPSASARFNITKQGTGTSYEALSPANSTNSSGHALYYFKPDSSYSTTNQNWLGFVETTDSCYQYNTSSVFNTTTWTNVPQLENATVDIISEGWGMQRTFNISIYDQNSTATVYLWRATSVSGPWIQMNSSSYTETGVWQNFNFTQTFDCGLQGIWYWMFNASNEKGNKNATTIASATNFTLTEDTVLLENIYGIDSIANRSNEQTDLLGISARDSNGTYLSGIMINFTATLASGVWGPVYGNTTNSSGYAVFYFNPGCAPKYSVGDRLWKAYLAEETSACYKANTTADLNLTIMGDITLDLKKPDGSINYTQEQTIPFLGSTTDDCGDALTTTVAFSANHSSAGYNCTSITPVGANAYTCDLPTTLSTNMGWYNTTMIANRSSHYTNQTTANGLALGRDSLFYLLAKLKVENPDATPTAHGWGYSNWNFSVMVSSGNPDQEYDISLLLGTTPPPTAICSEPTCLNQTPTKCLNCINNITYWYRNFSHDEIGTWYYKYDLGGTASDFNPAANKITVTKDNVSVNYVAGNNSYAEYLAAPTKLVLRITDLIKQQNVSTPAATVTFNMTRDSSNTLWQVVGTNTTNSSGEVTLYFTPDCSIQNGTRKWNAYINTTQDQYYNYNISEDFFIGINTEACTPSIDITSSKYPKEYFQNRSFGMNITVMAVQGNAIKTNATVVVPSGWTVWNGTDFSSIYYLENIAAGAAKDAHFEITPNASGNFTITVYANATMDAMRSDITAVDISVYKWLSATSAAHPAMPKTLAPNTEIIAAFNCESQNSRIANLTITSENMTFDAKNITLRVYVYNGTEWTDILHSYKINLSSARSDEIPILAEQLKTNETGYCTFKISNIGNNSINITGLTLAGYYNETIIIEDILAKAGDIATTGIEPSEGFFNITVRLANSESAGQSGTMWLNITNLTGDIVNSSSQAVSINGDSVYLANFTGMNTTSWAPGNYTMKASFIYGSKSAERIEKLIFETVSITSKTTGWMCNQTTEEYNVTVVHPFTDNITYNITLLAPAGWTYVPASQLIEATNPANYTATFNITASSSAAENITVNATANYTYPGIQKSKNSTYAIQESNSFAILEVVRETPITIGKDSVFDSRLSVHNKGCAASASGATIKESSSTGWTAANPGIKTNEYGSDITLISATTDLKNNVMTWSLGSIAPNKYAVLTYQIKSPAGTSQTGSLRYNATWDNKALAENAARRIQTFNYTGEPHLEFALDAIQQSAYPWPEPRSAQINADYNYSLGVINIGDTEATGWNVTLTLAPSCNVSQVYSSGIWNETARTITWQLANLAADGSAAALNYTANCTAEGKQVVTAKGIYDTRSQMKFTNITNIGCSGAPCSALESYTFTKPEGARYETMSEIDFYVGYNWTGYNITIAQGAVNFSGDSAAYSIAWQNFSFGAASGKIWSNYTIDASSESDYVEESRNIGVSSYTDATYNGGGNVTVEALSYIWKTGKRFSEPEQLFTKIKTYTYTPLLENSTLYINGNSSKTVGGWGEEFNFSAMVRDRFGRDVNISLWHKKGASYALVDSWVCASCLLWTQANFTYDYVGGDISSWDFKFNATNPDGAAELSGFLYTVEADEINTYNITPTWNMTVNRSQETNFTLQIYDRDNQTNPYYLLSGATDEGKGKIYISKFGSNETFDSSPAISSNNTGHLLRDMSNTTLQWCKVSDYYLGQNYWKGGASGAVTYKENITQPMPFMLVGDLSNSYMTLPDGTSNFTRASTINLEGTIKDDCNSVKSDPASFGAEYSLSHSGATYSVIAPINWTTWSPSGAPLGWYNVTMTSFSEGSENGKYNNGTKTLLNGFFLASVPQLNNPALSPYPAGSWQKSPFNFSVNITGEDNETISTILWIKNQTSAWLTENTTSCDHCANNTFITERNFSCENIGEWNYKFNATTVPGFSNETATYTFNVTKSAISINYAKGNNSKINRSDAEPGTSARLASQVWNLVLDNYTTDISVADMPFKIVNDSSNWRNENSTANSTHYILDFNPNCNYTAGQKDWKINTTTSCYADNTSAGFKLEIYGTLTAAQTFPDTTVNYTQGNQIPVNGTVTDDCASIVTGASVYFNITKGINTYKCPTAGYAEDNGDGTYNCTFDTTGKGGGYYNITMAVNKSYNNPDTDLRQNAYFMSAPIQLTNETVTPTPAGWGLTRNFSVIVNHYAGVNMTLWDRKSSGQYAAANKTFIPDPSNTQIDVFKNYTCPDIGIWFYKFNATDSSSQGNTSTSPATYELSTDSVTLGQTALGNATYVNRSLTTVNNSALLANSVNDTDRNLLASSPLATLYLNVTNDNGNTFVTYSSNSTNSSGYANFNFLPNCAYSVGAQKWKTYTSGDACYSNAISGNFTIYVQGDLRPNITYPLNLEEYQNKIDNVTINISLPDECGINKTGAQFNITLNNTDTSNLADCTNILELGGGNYSCEWNTTSTGVGRYDVIVLAYGLEYYNNGTTTRTDSFRVIPPINNPPNITNHTVSPNPGGWGGVFNFSVKVYDQDYDTTEVRFWISPDNESWTFKNAINCTACNGWNRLNFSYEGFTCENQQPWYFKFNATDFINNTELASGNFTVEKENVSIAYSAGWGNATYVNRTGPGTTRLVLRAFDAENTSVPALPAGRNGTFWAAYNSTYYDNGYFNTTNATGHLNYDFKPSCSPKYSYGPQNWTGGIVGDICYFDKNYTPQLIIYVVGDINDTLASPAGENYYENQNVTIRINTTEECSAEDTINDTAVYYNISHDTYSSTCSVSADGTGNYSCTWNVTGAPGGWYNITNSMNRTYFNSKTTKNVNAFFHQINPALKGASINKASVPFGSDVAKSQITFTVNVTDDDDIANVSLWESLDSPTGPWTRVEWQTCTDCINTAKTFTRTYSACGDIGTWYWKFNATDSSELGNETAVSSFEVIRRGVYFTHITGNNTNVSRVGSNITYLTIGAYDNYTSNTLGDGIQGYFWITTNGSGTGTWGPAQGFLTSGGALMDNFNPGCSPLYLTGQQDWKVGTALTTCYFAVNSTINYTLGINGTLSNTVNYPTNSALYPQGTNVVMYGAVSDDCTPTTGIYIAGAQNVKFDITGANEFTCSAVNDFNNGTYNCTWSSAGAFLGLNNITFNSSKAYYASASKMEGNAFRIGKKPETGNTYVDTALDGWGHNYTFSVEFQDPEPNDVDNITFWKAYSASGPWYYVDSENRTNNVSWVNVSFNKVFDCPDLTQGPYLYYKFNVTDKFGFTNESAVNNITLEKDDVDIIYVSGQSTIINREGSNSDYFVALVNDTDFSSPVGANINATVWKTTNNAIYDAGNETLTNASGYATYSFDPDCAYLASNIQKWLIGTTNNTCYKDKNMTGGFKTFSIIGQLKNELYYPPDKSIYNVTNSIPINFSVGTDCPSDGNKSAATTTLDLKHSGGTTYGCTPDDSGTGLYNCTWNSTEKLEGNYTVNLTTDLLNYNTNTTWWTNRFWLENLNSTYENNSVTPSIGGWSRNFTFNLSIDDPENDTIICTLFTNTTGNWVNRGNYTLAGGKGNCSIVVWNF
ncbi:hypothetical protein L6303_06120, partial [archaeon]|nr:hypothetical protein [archaeon]